MEDATTALFDLDGFTVVSVLRDDDGDVRGGRDVVVQGVEAEQACPSCGVFSGAVHARRTRRVKDVRHGRRGLRLFWDQRRWACRERACRRRTFAETSVQIAAGRRLTLRLREDLEHAVSASTRSGADVAREHGVSWWSVDQALIAKAARMTPLAPPGVRRLGVDETRTRAVRWLLAEHGWRRSDPWMTSFVDLDPEHAGGLLGLAPAGPARACRAGLPCSHASSGTASRWSRSTPVPRSPPRCARRCPQRSWSWITGIWTSWAP